MKVPQLELLLALTYLIAVDSPKLRSVVQANVVAQQFLVFEPVTTGLYDAPETINQ